MDQSQCILTVMGYKNHKGRLDITFKSINLLIINTNRNINTNIFTDFKFKVEFSPDFGPLIKNRGIYLTLQCNDGTEVK